MRWLKGMLERLEYRLYKGSPTPTARHLMKTHGWKAGYAYTSSAYALHELLEPDCGWRA